jgi:hypothetical protein
MVLTSVVVAFIVLLYKARRHLTLPENSPGSLKALKEAVQLLEYDDWFIGYIRKEYAGEAFVVDFCRFNDPQIYISFFVWEGDDNFDRVRYARVGMTVRFRTRVIDQKGVATWNPSRYVNLVVVGVRSLRK